MAVSYKVHSTPFARFIPTLDGWRALAILLVILCHTLEPENRIAVGGWYAKHLFTVLYKIGPLGVSLFFGISGYLITTRLVLEESKLGAVSLSKFYLRRAFRILPAASTYLAVIFILSATGILVLYPGELWSSLFFVRNYWPHGFWYTGHFWSLAMEEHFYLVWPVIFVLLGRNRAAWVAAALAFATIVWRPFGSHINLQVPLLHRTDLRADALLWPSVLAIVLAGSSKIADTIRRICTPAVGILAGGLMVVAVVLATRDVSRTVESLLVPVVILSTVFSPEALLGPILEWEPLSWIGRISYSLYLWQQLFLFPGEPVWQIPFRVAGVFACACLSYYLVEKPMIRLARRLEERMNRHSSLGARHSAAA